MHKEKKYHSKTGEIGRVKASCNADVSSYTGLIILREIGSNGAGGCTHARRPVAEISRSARVKNSTESRPRATPLHTKVASRSASTSPYQISLPTPPPTHTTRQAPACVSMLAQACDVRRVINFT
ncbi:unnamed protein product [Arctia plantaginis]|uniref:Uncharacterized protein n=1 Tax=Arctia plantaginis TaxID=874455 RepID=A0A8S0ZKH4_ARCPL|nr:unnamed protein product [Arctia plantaginis]